MENEAYWNGLVSRFIARLRYSKERSYSIQNRSRQISSLRRVQSSSLIKTFQGRATIGIMESSSDLVGQVVWLPGGVKVRVEHIYEEDDPPRARTRRVGGPHDGIQAFIEVWKLEPCDETDETQQQKLGGQKSD